MDARRHTHSKKGDGAGERNITKLKVQLRRDSGAHIQQEFSQRAGGESADEVLVEGLSLLAGEVESQATSPICIPSIFNALYNILPRWPVDQ